MNLKLNFWDHIVCLSSSSFTRYSLKKFYYHFLDFNSLISFVLHTFS